MTLGAKIGIENASSDRSSKYNSVHINESKVLHKTEATVGRIGNLAGFKQNFTFQAKLSFALFEVFGVIKRQKFCS